MVWAYREHSTTCAAAYRPDHNYWNIFRHLRLRLSSRREMREGALLPCYLVTSDPRKVSLTLLRLPAYLADMYVHTFHTGGNNGNKVTKSAFCLLRAYAAMLPRTGDVTCRGNILVAKPALSVPRVDFYSNVVACYLACYLDLAAR